MQPLAPNAYAGPRHTRTYRILNHDLGRPECRIEVHATEAEVDRLATDGFLVRPGLFRGEVLERLGRAVDEMEARERAADRAWLIGERRYAGIFLTELLDKDPVFLQFARTPALLSVARAVLGPRVMVVVNCRITMPGAARQETHWHFHQRINMDPAPPFFAPHHVIDCLVYLDDLDTNSGPLCVVPGSHRWERRDLPADDYDDMEGQVEIREPAGTAVIMHTNVWHRGKPNTPEGHRRRLVMLAYTGITMDHLRNARLPEGGVIARALATGDPELAELVGAASGYGEWSGHS